MRGSPIPRGADEARLADASGNAFAEQGDVFGASVACEGKTQGAACRRGIDAHCGEDVRRFGGAGCAGRARGGRNACSVKQDHEQFAIDVVACERCN